MSLGRVGLVGSLGRKANANIVIWASPLFWMANSGQTRVTLTGSLDVVSNDERMNHKMPFDGKFTQLKFIDRGGTWRGDLALQKNNVDTALFILHDPPSTSIDTVTVDVPFIKGDSFKFRGNTTGIGGINNGQLLLLGGFTGLP